MPQAQLVEIELELRGYSIVARPTSQNELDIQLYGQEMDSDNAQDAQKVISQLQHEGLAVKRSTSCAECMTCSQGCLIMPHESTLEVQLDQLMRAVSAAMHTTGEIVTLRFEHLGRPYSFLARWEGSLGSSGYDYLRNRWEYGIDSPTEQLLAAIRTIPGVVKATTEPLQGMEMQVLDVFVSSGSTSLQNCLAEVVDLLATSS